MVCCVMFCNIQNLIARFGIQLFLNDAKFRDVLI